MTTVARYSPKAAPTPVGYRDRTVTGTEDELAPFLARYAATGTVVAANALRRSPDTDFSQVSIRIRPREPITPTPAIQQAVHAETGAGRRLGRVTALVGAFVGVTAGLITAAAYVLGALLSFLANHAVVMAGALTVIVLSALALSRVTGGGRRHCPGC